MVDPLSTWNDGAAKSAIIDFVTRVTTSAGPTFVPVADRIATFDNDGTLWCEKPLVIQLNYILQRWVEMATQDPTLRDQQPWKAAVDEDYAWFNEVVTKHYEGDDSGIPILLKGLLAAYGCTR